jgi:hypothetical protein
MIILIGGTGCVGKTQLAHILMTKHTIPYLSIDHLMMGIYRSSNNCGYTPESPVETISVVLWPIVREMAKTNIENRNSFIYEGFQILPDNVNELDMEYRKEVIPVFLCFHERYIRNNYKHIESNRGVIEKRTDGVDNIDKMINENNRIINGCELNDIRPYIIYENEMVEIIKGIDLTIAST